MIKHLLVFLKPSCITLLHTRNKSIDLLNLPENELHQYSIILLLFILAAYSKLSVIICYTQQHDNTPIWQDVWLEVRFRYFCVPLYLWVWCFIHSESTAVTVINPVCVHRRSTSPRMTWSPPWGPWCWWDPRSKVMRWAASRSTRKQRQKHPPFSDWFIIHEYKLKIELITADACCRRMRAQNDESCMSF